MSRPNLLRLGEPAERTRLRYMYSAECPTGKYVIEYGANTSVGNGTVTIKGVGEYGGTKTVKFKILPRIFK